MSVVDLTWRSALSYPDPYRDVAVEVAFTAPSGRRVEVDAFWDGGDRWRARMALDEAGVWLYRATASRRDDRGLHDRYGRCRCTFPAAPAVTVSADTPYFQGQDGRPCLVVGDATWEALGTTEAEAWGVYLGLRRLQGFTAVHTLLLPRAGTPWVTVDAEGRPQPQPGRLAQLERRLDAVVAHGLLPVLGIFPAVGPEDWGNRLAEPEAVRLGRYFVARFAALRPLWLLAVGADCAVPHAARWARIGAEIFSAGGAPMAGILPRAGIPESTLDAQPWLRFLALPATVTVGRGPRPILLLDAVERSGASPATARAFFYRALLGGPVGGLSVAPTASAFLDTAGTRAVTRLRSVLAGVPWTELRPAPSVLAECGGEPAAVAARTRDGRDLVVYVPVGAALRLADGALPRAASARWINPAAGSWWRADPSSLVPPPAGQDWLLHIHGAALPHAAG